MQKVAKETQDICKDITKWLQDNFDNFVEDFQPSHIKYNVSSFAVNS